MWHSKSCPWAWWTWMDWKGARLAIAVTQGRNNEVSNLGSGRGVREGVRLCLISTLFHSLIFGSFVSLTSKAFPSFPFWVWDEMVDKRADFFFFFFYDTAIYLILKPQKQMFFKNWSWFGYRYSNRYLTTSRTYMNRWRTFGNFCYFCSLKSIYCWCMQLNCITWDFCVQVCECLSKWLRKIWGRAINKNWRQ